MNHDQHWFAAANFTRVGEFLIDNGVVPGDLFKAASASPIVLMDRDSRIPRSDALRLRNTMAKMLNDPLAPMKVSARQPISDYGVPGVAVTRASTVGEAIGLFTRCIHLAQSGTRFDLDTSKDRARLSVKSIGNTEEDTSLHLQSATLWMYRMARLTGHQMPIEVRLGCAAAASPSRYEEFLGARPVFGVDRYEVVFDREILALPLNTECDSALPMCSLPMEFDLAEGPPAVHRFIIQTLPHARPTIERTAAKFGTSSRTLQRMLQRWGLPFEGIVDEVRQTRAKDLIDGSKHAMMEVAFLLGYSDQAHFSRSFRRWTGISPGAYRKRRLHVSSTYPIKAVDAQTISQ